LIIFDESSRCKSRIRVENLCGKSEGEALCGGREGSRAEVVGPKTMWHTELSQMEREETRGQ
jgi:hypothetical protein